MAGCISNALSNENIKNDLPQTTNQIHFSGNQGPTSPIDLSPTSGDTDEDVSPSDEALETKVGRARSESIKESSLKGLVNMLTSAESGVNLLS